VVELRIVDVDLERVYAHDRAVLLVQFCDAAVVEPAEDGVVVELVPQCCGGEFGAGERRRGG
jgi:hypothetical protein